jgi:hypothetical protein
VKSCIRSGDALPFFSTPSLVSGSLKMKFSLGQQIGTICGYAVSPSATSASGAAAVRGTGGLRLPGPQRGPAQFLLGTPWPEDLDRGQTAFQSDGLTNRRMRARMSGGMGGDGATRPLPDSMKRLDSACNDLFDSTCSTVLSNSSTSYGAAAADSDHYARLQPWARFPAVRVERIVERRAE